MLWGDSGGFVSVSSPEVSSVADVFEVWERYVAPQSDYVYGVNFLGHISLKKEPQNFVEFYSANKWEKNFPQILENAVLKKAPFLFFNAKDNDNDEENQYMFDCFLGSGVQGIVARAFKINDPSCVIAVKMFGFRLDDSFGTIIDLIANEIIGRKIANKNMIAQLLYPKSQSICGRESLIMEYIDGCTLKEFYKKNPNLSKEQTDYFEKNLKLVLPTHDLTDTNVMVRLNKESGLYDIVQIDLALLQL